VFLIGGIASVFFGLLAFVNPGIALFVLATFFAVYLLVDGISNVIGVFLLMLGYKVRQATTREWILYAMGAASILFGAFLVMNPAVGNVTIIHAIASWAVIIGVLKVIIAFKVKQLPERA
jgi:uncharacterized membrane protein HdeD (DUF308 family)